MTNKRNDLILLDFDRNTLENLHILFGRIVELNIIEVQLTSGAICASWSLVALKLDLVWSDHENSHFVGRSRHLCNRLDVVGDRARISHDRAHVHQDSEDRTNGHVIVLVLKADDVNDSKVTASSKQAKAHEEERPEVASCSAIFEDMLILQGKLQAVNLFIGKRFDCADITKRLSSHIAQLSLGLLVGDCE